MPYALVGFPVNNAIGEGSDPEPSIASMVALSADVLPRLLLKTVETLREEDLIFDHGYVYRVEGGI